jgi:hypothetical protein
MSDDAGLGSVDWNLCNEQENEADDKVGQVKIKGSSDEDQLRCSVR